MLLNNEHKLFIKISTCLLPSSKKKSFNVSIYRQLQHGKVFYRLRARINKGIGFFFYIRVDIFVSTWNDIFINKWFPFVCFFFGLRRSEPLIREKLMSNKLLIEWRHDLCAEITKKRYISDQEVARLAHLEVVNLFFPLETSDESDEINSETSDKSSKFFPPILTSRNHFMVFVII